MNCRDARLSFHAENAHDLVRQPGERVLVDSGADARVTGSGQLRDRSRIRSRPIWIDHQQFCVHSIRAAAGINRRDRGDAGPESRLGHAKEWSSPAAWPSARRNHCSTVSRTLTMSSASLAVKRSFGSRTGCWGGSLSSGGCSGRPPFKPRTTEHGRAHHPRAPRLFESLWRAAIVFVTFYAIPSGMASAMSPNRSKWSSPKRRNWPRTACAS